MDKKINLVRKQKLLKGSCQISKHCIESKVIQIEFSESLKDPSKKEMLKEKICLTCTGSDFQTFS